MRELEHVGVVHKLRVSEHELVQSNMSLKVIHSRSLPADRADVRQPIGA